MQEPAANGLAIAARSDSLFDLIVNKWDSLRGRRLYGREDSVGVRIP